MNYQLQVANFKSKAGMTLSAITLSGNLLRAAGFLCRLIPVLVFFSGSVGAQERHLAQSALVLSPDDIRESMIAFVNLSTAPGIDGAVFTVDEPQRDADLLRSSVGYAAEFGLQDYVMDGYWGMALVNGRADDRLIALDENGVEQQLDLDRNILSLRGTLGLALPFTAHFKLRPYLSLATSRLESRADIKSLSGAQSTESRLLDSEVDALTTSGTVIAMYDRWFTNERLELSGQYTLAYTDTYSSENQVLDAWGWNETALLRARWSDDTGWRMAGRPWRWNTYATHTRFLGLEKKALGFTRYTEIGVGMDYEWNIRPLDWFGMRYIGIKAGLIIGDDVEGLSVGLYF